MTKHTIKENIAPVIGVLIQWRIQGGGGGGGGVQMHPPFEGLPYTYVHYGPHQP